MRKARLGLQAIEREAGRLKTLLGISPDLVSPLLALPMLRGLWIGSVADVSGHGNHLTYHGDPYFSFDGLAPFWDLDGAGDYLDITDAASGGNFDILGTEAYVAAGVRGVTVLGWFYLGAMPGTFDGLITKWNTASQRAYAMEMSSLGYLQFYTSDDGSWGAPHNDSVSSSNNVGTGKWFFAAGAWSSTWTKVMLGTRADGLVSTYTSSITASLFNSTANLTIGAEHGGASPVQGRSACCAVCACYLYDLILNNVFEQQRAAFGV